MPKMKAKKIIKKAVKGVGKAAIKGTVKFAKSMGKYKRVNPTKLSAAGKKELARLVKKKIKKKK